MSVTRLFVGGLKHDSVARFHNPVPQNYHKLVRNAIAYKSEERQQIFQLHRNRLQDRSLKMQTSISTFSCMHMRQFFEWSSNRRYNFRKYKRICNNDYRYKSWNKNVSQAMAVYPSAKKNSSLLSIEVQYLLIFLLFGSLLITSSVVSADEDLFLTDERIRALLANKNRNTEETLELYELLLERGMEVAKQIEGKDVLLIIGETSAGKTTLANFLRGCSFIKVGDNIIEDPRSSLKPVGKIGTKPESETYVPEKLPEITFTVFNPNKSAYEKFTFTPVDFPGTKDTHGIGVEGPTAEAIREIALKARSVRIILTVEYDHTSKAGKGAKWREIVELFDHRFNGLIGRGKNDLCVLITKTQDKESALERIKWASENQACTDFSPYVEIYDPLESAGRTRLLNTIIAMRAYPGGRLTTNVVMSEDQLFKASKLGNEVANLVEDRLQEDTPDSIHNAIRKTQFTYRMAKLGNEYLKGPHKTVERKVQERARSIAGAVRPNEPDRHPTLTQIAAFQKYKALKDKFGAFEISFAESDRDVKQSIQQTSSEEKSTTQTVGTSVTGAGLAVTAGGVYYPPLFVAGSIISGVGLLIKGVGAARRAWWRTDDEKQRDVFFKGP